MDSKVSYFFTQMRGARKDNNGKYASRKFAKQVSNFLRLLRRGNKTKLHAFVDNYIKSGGE